MKRLVLTIAILIGLAAPAWAGFAEGYAAYKRGDYATALREFRPLAEQGEAEAQVNLGTMYGSGIGVPQDYAAAVKWYRKTAEQGNAESQFYLGGMYDKGKGIPQDYAKAVKWYRKAAKQGYANAQHNLGVKYAKGQGVSQDADEAVKWFRKAAKQGLAYAQTGLGFAYYEGHDYSEAMKWYRKGAEQGDALAQSSLGFMYFRGDGVSQDYVLAHTWFSIALANMTYPLLEERYEWDRRKEAVHRLSDAEREMTPAQIAEARRLFRQWSINRKLPRQEPKVARTPPPRQRPTPRASKVSSTGTGFFVTRAGYLLTNEHVVADCRKVTLQPPGKRRLDAWVVVRDKINDLALLKTDAKTSHVAVLRSGKSVRPGDEIVSFGFPLSGILSSRGNLTVGRISALAGLRDDSRFLQITAPVQPGNSGGPLFDLSGNVVGIVESKLSALKVAMITGDIPQNVNFAIKRRIIEGFLNASDVKYATSRPVKRLDPSEVGEIAKKFTVKVECWG